MTPEQKETINQLAKEISEASKNPDSMKEGSIFDYLPSAGALIKLGTAASIATLIYGASKALENTGKELENNAYKGLDLTEALESLIPHNIGASFSSFSTNSTARNLRGDIKDTELNIYDSQASWTNNTTTFNFPQQNNMTSGETEVPTSPPTVSQTPYYLNPAVTPTYYPSPSPSQLPSLSPSLVPSLVPSLAPTFPSQMSNFPTPSAQHPTPQPTVHPTGEPTKHNQNPSEKEELSAGAIAGIVIGSTVAFCAFVAGCIRSSTPSNSAQAYDGVSMGERNTGRS